LRVSAPAVLADRIVAPVVIELLERHSGLRIDVWVTDRSVEPAREGFDVALLLDPREDPSARSRSLGQFTLYPVASPRFIARYGRPDEPVDLVRFKCIGASSEETWSFDEGEVRIEPTLAINRWEVAREAAVQGIGIARLPVLLWQADYEASELLPVLGKHPAGTSRLVARYRASRYSHPTVRAFLNRLTLSLAALDPWPRGA
ncbi:MAG: substrate binding domain-containing protein, partial [Myxococcota bacterium]